MAQIAEFKQFERSYHCNVSEDTNVDPFACEEGLVLVGSSGGEAES